MKNPMIEGVRWSERYAHYFEKCWSILPKYVAQSLLTVVIFVLAAGIQGNWLAITMHFMKQFGYFNASKTHDDTIDDDAYVPWLHVAGFSVLGSYSIYFGLGGFLHWYFYVRQRDKANEWKCQPEKFLSPEMERHEIFLGTCSMMYVSLLGATLAWHSVNDGRYATIYYAPDAYGWSWFFIQFAVIFVWQDYGTYWTHRFYHTPYFYKHFHKLHHTYKQPTAFSVTAIHPVEIVHMQLVLFSPALIFPVHWFPFYAVLLYTYYHAIIDHSGITFKAQWWQPWQPDAIFHDNHHQYTHVNYGFNIIYWDKLHGTYRNKYRVYTEDIFYGKGKALHELTNEERLLDMAERRSENPLAYRDNVNVNELDDSEYVGGSKDKKTTKIQ